jgi:hypothetical protein
LSLKVDSGAWHCFHCGAHGLLAEHKTKREDAADPLRPKRRPPRRSAPVAPPVPSPAELAEDKRRREDAARLWRVSVPVDAPEAAPGAAYLAGRGIPLDVAAGADVRYHARYPDWVDGTTHYHAALVFRVQDEAGAGVAIESRYLEPRADSSKGKSRGAKGRGVFVATPGALDVPGVTLCEGPLTALSMAACGFACVALCRQDAPPWLARRLALRDVVIAFDEGETYTEPKAAKLAAALAAVGARPYRLRLPAGEDVNDYLQRVGRETARATLSDVICRALVPS